MFNDTSANSVMDPLLNIDYGKHAYCTMIFLVILLSPSCITTI